MSLDCVDQTQETSRTPEALQPAVLFRGLTFNHSEDRFGEWWTNNPYLALRYSRNGKGSFLIAIVDQATLQNLRHEVSQVDSEFEIYTFPDQDPPGARHATPEELEALRALMITPEEATKLGIPEKYHSQPCSLPWPDNPVEIGRNILGYNSSGQLAVSQTIAL